MNFLDPLSPKQSRAMRAFNKLHREHGRCTVRMLADDLACNTTSAFSFLQVLVRKGRVEKHGRSYVPAETAVHRLVHAYDLGDDDGVASCMERVRELLYGSNTAERT